LRARTVELNDAKRPGCAMVLRALATQHPELERFAAGSSALRA
jgi:hypothetical protein